MTGLVIGNDMKKLLVVSMLSIGLTFSGANAEANDHNINWKALVEVKPVSIKSIDKKKQNVVLSLSKFKDTNLFVYFVDLNNDFIEDIFIFHTDKGICPNSGCRTQLLMSRHEDIYDDVAKHSFEIANTFILQGVTNKVHDLLFRSVSTSYNAATNTHSVLNTLYTRKQWNGKAYDDVNYIQIDFPRIEN
jgi:hypothetical protein